MATKMLRGEELSGESDKLFPRYGPAKVFPGVVNGFRAAECVGKFKKWDAL